MNILEMTDSEIYELGRKALISKLGAAKTQWFIRQCQPGTGDYSVDRHQFCQISTPSPSAFKNAELQEQTKNAPAPAPGDLRRARAKSRK